MREIPVFCRLLPVMVVSVLALAGCAPSAQPTQPPRPTEAQGTKSVQQPTQPAKPEPTKPAAAKQPEWVTLKMGALAPNISNSAIYIAEAKGYFKEQGITLEMIQFRSGDEQAASIATGALDIGSGGPNAGLYNAAARGVYSKLVADKGHSAKGFEWFQYVANKELYDRGEIRSMKDIKGRKVAIVGRGASGEVATMRALEKLGYKPEDIDIVVMPFPDMVPALANKSVDIAMVIEPQLTQIVQQGIGVPIGTSQEFYPDQQIAAIFYSEKFIKEKPEVAKRWMVAYVKGLRDYNDGVVKGKGKDELVRILINAKAVPNAEFFDKMNKVALDPNGYINVESIQYDMEAYLARGMVTQKVPVELMIDHSFVEHALQVLGKYQ